ncbi:hypothetical protein JZU68_07775, partial [bacterium]|nr:hypothetical protein [bacterium]
IAENALVTIQKNSSRGKDITIFEKNGKFLIAEHKELIDPGEMLVFESQAGKYIWVENGNDFFEFIGDIQPDAFIKNALITVGAEDLYPVVEPYALKLRQNQDKFNNDCIKWRELNQTIPLLNLEIYRIETNYVPRLVQKIPCHSYESGLFLPEYQFLQKTDERTTYLLREIATNKVIEGSLDEAIEHAKYQKWARKHPPFMNPGDMMRMELDDDDPDFLSWDDYIANDDEFEEGDDEYSPNM